MCLQYSSSLHTCACTVSCTQKREIGWTLKKESWNNWGDRKICLETTIGCGVVDCKTNTAQYWTRCPWWCWPQLWHIWLSVWILNIISGRRSFAKYYFWKGEGSLNFVLSRLWPLALPSSLLVPLVWATEPTIAIDVGIVSRWMGAFLNCPVYLNTPSVELCFHKKHITPFILPQVPQVPFLVTVSCTFSSRMNGASLWAVHVHLELDLNLNIFPH